MKTPSSQLLEEIKERIIKTMRPEKIILFGSHAWGTPEEGSDLDLFIVVPWSDQPAYQRAREVYRALRGLDVAIDVVVQTQEEVERGRKVATSLARRVLEQGRVLYG